MSGGLSDLEIVRACAEAMGFDVIGENVTSFGSLADGKGRVDRPDAVMLSNGNWYDPLHDDAAMMQLAKKFPFEFELSVIEWCNHLRRGENFDLSYHFCGRIAEIKNAGD